MSERILTLAETAEMLGVSTRTVFRYLQADYPYQLKGYKVGKAWKIKESDIQAFIEAHSNQKSGKIGE